MAAQLAHFGLHDYLAIALCCVASSCRVGRWSSPAWYLARGSDDDGLVVCGLVMDACGDLAGRDGETGRKRRQLNGLKRGFGVIG